MRYTEKQARALLKSLNDKAAFVNVSNIASEILDNERFFYWSGSHSVEKHHYGNHGLLVHTHEVVTFCGLILDNYITEDPNNSWDLVEDKLFLAALFHDAGKMHDYDWAYEVNNPPMKTETTLPSQWPHQSYNVSWFSTKHKSMVYHLPRSAIIWEKAKEKHGYKDDNDDVLHAILAHHGCREWGSSVSPQTPIAWILHCCDSMSARVDEAVRYQT